MILTRGLAANRHCRRKDSTTPDAGANKGPEKSTSLHLSTSKIERGS
jgi:hypothetical protein